MIEQILVLKKDNVSPEQLVYIMELLRMEICPTQVEKAKHKLAEALCEINSIDELNEISSYFNNKLTPFFRYNIEQIQEILKRNC